MESILLNFIPTKEDYARTTRDKGTGYKGLAYAAIMWSAGNVFNILFFGCLTVFALKTLSSKEPQFAAVLLSSSCLLFCLFLPIFSLVVLPFRAGREAEIDERLRAPVTWEVDDTGVRIAAGDHSETKYDWHSFRHVYSTNDYYYLTYRLKPREAQFIPKRAFESPEHEAAFRAMVEAHLGTIKK